MTTPHTTADRNQWLEQRLKLLAREKELVAFLKEKGLKIYEPDVAAFRKHAQEKYLASDLAKDWPQGMIDKINAL